MELTAVGEGGTGGDCRIGGIDPRTRRIGDATGERGGRTRLEAGDDVRIKGESSAGNRSASSSEIRLQVHRQTGRRFNSSRGLEDVRGTQHRVEGGGIGVEVWLDPNRTGSEVHLAAVSGEIIEG